ncbi:MAG TPA: formate dehydrogenase accessory sulfurtransferase FdhD [Gemmatimonadaceae bacterium]|nr:formate dehydrogenase accessory sulfurtransferase FdhD [Gemmatimonadaceae bacterium]
MAVAEHPLTGLGYARVSSDRPLVRITGARAVHGSASVAEEIPIALVYNGRPYVVVMGTPADLEDLAIGFSLTEAIVEHRAAVERVEVVRASHGIELQIQIPAEDAGKLEARARGMAARTGCGLCGIERIGDVLRLPTGVARSLTIARDALWRSSAELSRAQTINNDTSTVHAAGWSTSDGVLRVAREDVGRHNALDKVLGALARAGTTASDGFVVVTSRASYEMVQKTAMCGVELLAAISRPTGLAIRFAESAGVTLVGLLRGDTANVYTHPERIHPLSVEA